MKRRSIKSTPKGTYTKAEVRAALRSVHVLDDSKGGWEVRSIGPKRVTESFATKKEAIDYAKSVQHARNIVVHNKKTPKVAVIETSPRRNN